MRDFGKWISNFKKSISGYEYYIDFAKVHRNVDEIKVELNILNSLIGSADIEKDFDDIIAKYPETLKCIPLLLAVRSKEIFAVDDNGQFEYNFHSPNQTKAQYSYFMRKTGLFNLMEKHIVHSLVDYVTGIETGLDSNGRKNRGGHLMERLVKSYIDKAGFKLGQDYFKEMRISDIENKWNIDLSLLSNKGKTVKRFDFVIKTAQKIYAIETNFYASSGSKLNETARSYKNIALESKSISGFSFVWFTDGEGWKSAKNNLQETFEAMEHLYCIADLENDIISNIIV